MDNKISIVNKAILFDRWATLTAYTIQNKEEEEFERVVFDAGDGAAVFLYNPRKKTALFVRQIRYGIMIRHSEDAYLMEVCAGLIDGQPPNEAVIREVQEETGMAIDKVEHVCTIFPTPGAVAEKLHLYAANYSSSKKVHDGGGLNDEHEQIEVIELSYDQIKSFYKDGFIKDAKTLILIQWAMLNGIIE